MPYPGFIRLAPLSEQKISERNINKKFNWQGMVPDIFDFLASHLNFSYDLALSRDGNWGSLDLQSGGWNGIIKDLMEGVADISPTSLSVLNSRSLVIDYLPSFYTEANTFIISTKSSYLSWIFLAPFHISTWIILFLFTIWLSFSLFISQVLISTSTCRLENMHQSFVDVYGSFGSFAAVRWPRVPGHVSAQ